MQRAHSNYSKTHDRYFYQGSEMDKEVKGDGNSYSYTTTFRQLAPRLGRWMSIDPKATAWESPYVSMGNNPIWFNDPIGDVFDVGNNEKSKSDIKSIAKSKNQNYIKIDENNRVTLDFGGLSQKKIDKILKRDKGLSLVKNLVDANEKFLYEASEVFLGRNENGDREGVIMQNDNNGVLNASEWGCDSKGALTHRPKEGYDGQVVIKPDVSGKETSNVSGNLQNKPSAALVFHELVENFERTHNGVSNDLNNPNGAHNLAIKRELEWHGKSEMPGEYNEITEPRLSPAELKKARIELNNYLIE